MISKDTHRKDLKQPLVPAEGYPYRNTLILDMPGEIWKPIPRLLDRSGFVYGGTVHLSMELFLTDGLLLLVKAQGRLCFGSDVNLFRPALSPGFRINL